MEGVAKNYWWNREREKFVVESPKIKEEWKIIQN